jgi:hypothetical protein
MSELEKCAHCVGFAFLNYLSELLSSCEPGDEMTKASKCIVEVCFHGQDVIHELLTEHNNSFLGTVAEHQEKVLHLD